MNDVLVADNDALSMTRFSFITYCLVGWTCFFMPISPSLFSIGLSLLSLLIVLTPAYRSQALALFKTSWGAAVSCFFLFASLACLWGEADWHDKFVVLLKHSKLLYLPVLATIFLNRMTRFVGLQALLGGVSVTAVLSILSYVNWVPFLHIDPDYVFKNHIIMGLMGASGAYIAAYLAIKAKGMVCGLYSALCLLLGFQVLWINEGRMGYVLCLFLMGWLSYQYRKNRVVMAFIMSLLLIFTMLYGMSTVRQARMQKLSYEWHELSNHASPMGVQKATSVGFRVQFYSVAKEMLFTHPIVGYGTAGFGDYVIKHHLFADWHSGRLREPHSQYALVGAELGAIGLCLLSWVFVALFVTIKRGKVLGWMGMGVLIAFCLNQWTDSMLFYSPGYFLILIMAMCLGEAHENSV